MEEFVKDLGLAQLAIKLLTCGLLALNVTFEIEVEICMIRLLKFLMTKVSSWIVYNKKKIVKERLLEIDLGLSIPELFSVLLSSLNL